MKTVLILVLSCEVPPYNKLIDVALSTWDSIQVDNTETIFYCGISPEERTDSRIKYFPIPEGLFNMGRKDLLCFDWVLKNKEFDYIARVNSSCYVNKKCLIEYIQSLPDTNVFAGLEVTSPNQIKDQKWIWGGGQIVMSRDVLQKISDNHYLWDHKEMEDIAISRVINQLNISYTPGRLCSINKIKDRWLCLLYGGGENFEFTDFSDLSKIDNQFFYRVKQDGIRETDEFIMNEIHKVLT